jgi:hypothetical protein
MPDYKALKTAFRNQCALISRIHISSQQFQPLSQKLDSVLLHPWQIEFSEGEAG